MNKGIFKFRVFRRRRTACRIVAAFSAFAMLCVASLPAFAAPTAVLDNDLGGAAFNYIKGATHNQIDADHATFTASGQGGLIDWQALNVGSGQGLNFQGNQFFNVVSGGDRSQIAGTLEASGALWIFNPAGVSFLNGANVTAGGLFAVATANLANKSEIEAAIEAGSAIPTPVIGGWGTGKISSEQGAEFSADAVTMLGRSMDLAGGDFSKVGSLSVGGGGKTVVDEVGGGKVSINLGDFLDDADVDGISVELGDINLGDKDNPTGKQGDLTVATEGSILVKGAVKADGDIVFKSLAGDGATGPVISYKNMSVASGKLLQGKSVSATAAGRVTVDGVVEATGDEAGVEIESGLYTGINGSVKAVKDITVTAQGNVNVAGTVESSVGSVSLAAEGADKSVKVGWNGSAASAGALVSGATGVEMTGKISSQILAGEVTAAEGDVSLSGGEYVAVAGKATAESGDVNLSTTESATLSSDVGGTSYKAGDTAGVLVLGEGQVKASGDVVVNSVGAFQTTDGTSVEAGDSGTLSVNAAEGTDIGGDFTTANMTIAGNEAVVTISKEIDITGDLVIDNAANISVESGISANDITFKGTKTTVAGDIAGNDLAVKTADGSANADLKQTAGVIDVNSITAANIEQTGGTITAADYIKADGEIKQNGDNATTVMSAKTIEATTVGQTGGKIVASEKVKADVTQSGCEIDTPEIQGNLTQTDASDVATVGNVTGDVLQSAAATLKSSDSYNGGNLDIGGKLEQTAEGATVDVSGGKLTLGGALTQTAGTIKADTLNLDADSSVAGKVEATTIDAEGTTLAASGDIDATTVRVDTLNITDGTVDATGIEATTLDVDGGTVTAGTIAADVEQVGGAVAATTSITGDVNVDGAASTLETAKIDGDITQENGTVAADEVTGAAKVNGGTLTASKLGSLEQTSGEVVAKDDALTVSGTTQQSGGTLGDDTATITLTGALTQSGGTIAASELSFSGGAEQTDPNGTVDADTLVLADSDFNVTLDKGANKIGSVYGRVKNIALKDTDGGLVIGNDMNNLEAEGNVSIETVGDMTEFGGDYGKIVARNGKTTVTSTDGNINLDHGWNMFSEVEATAEKGSVNIVNAIGYDPSNPAAVQNLKVDGATAKNDVRIVSKDTVTIAGAVDATEGNIRLESTKATLNVDAVVSGNNVTLAAANGITENAAVSAAADKYVHATDGNINVNATATVGGDVAYVANKTTGKIVTGDGATIGSTGGGTTYKSDNTGTIAANGSMTSKDGVTTFKDASVVAIDTTDSVVVENDGVAVTVGEISGGASVTEVLADPSGGPAADGTDTVALDSSSVSGITAKDVAITVAGDPGDVAVSVEKAIATTDGDVSIATDNGDVNIQADVVATGGDVTVDAGDSIMVDSTGAISGKSVALTANGTGDGKGIQIAGGVSATDGTLDITATGADGISLTGTVTADNGATTLTANNGAISAANADNDFKSVTANAKAVTLKDIDDLDLAGVAVAETLDVTAQSLTDSAANTAKDVKLAVTGDATLDADNDFDTVQGAAANLTLNDKDDVALTAVMATSGAVDVEAAGNADVLGSVVADGGSVSIKATGAGKSVRVGGSVAGKTGVTLEGDKSVQVGGDVVSSDGDVALTAKEFVAIDGGTVTADKGTATLKTTDAELLTAGGAAATYSEGQLAGVMVGGASAGAVSAKDVVVESAGSVLVNTDSSVTGADSVTIAANGETEATAATSGITKQGVYVLGDVTATGGDLSITAEGEGGIQASGVLVADNGATTLTAANGSIDAQNEDNDFQSLTATAKSVTLNDKEDITLTEVVSSDGDVRVKAMTGNLTVADATTDKVTATGDIRLESSEGEMTIGAGVSGNNVTLSAKGDVVSKKEDGVSNGALSASNGGDLLVESTDGNIVLAADASAADTATLFAEKGSINAAKIDAPTAYAKGKGDVTIGDVTGTLVTTTEGNIDVEFKDDADHAIAYNAGGYVNVKAKGGLVVDSATPEGADLKVTEVLWPEDTADRTLVDHNVADTQVSGVTAGKEASLESTASSIEVRTGVDAGTTASLNAKADVTVFGTVSGKTGVTIDADGDVTVDGAVVKAGEFADETTGAVKPGSNADFAIAAGNGVTVQNGATVAATGTAEVTASGANGVTVTGTDTKIVADKSLTVQTTTGDGSVVVSEGAYVAARNSVDGNMVTISSEKGSVTVSGAATAVEAGKDLSISGAKGVTIAQAKAGANGSLSIGSAGENASVNVADGAKVLAEGGIGIAAADAVTVDDAAVAGKAGVTVEAGGDVTVDGAVVKAGVIDETTGEVSGEAANLAVAAGGSVTVDGGAKVGSSGATAIDAASGVTVDGASYVGANTTLDVGTTDGKTTASLTVQDSAQLVARDNLTAKTSGNIDINSSAKVASDKTLKLEATGDESSVNVNGGAKVLAAEDIDIDAKGAVLVDNATVAAKGDVLVGDATTRAGSFAAKNGATVTADGSVAAYVSGNATVAKGTGTRTEVSGKTDVILDATGAVEVNGAVVKAGVIDETTGEVSGEAANLAVAAGGAVTVDGGAKVGSSGATAIDAASGVTVKGASYVGANTTLDVGTTDGKATASLTVQDSSQLVARGSLTAKASGAVVAEGGAKVASDAGVDLDGETVTVQDGAKVLAEGGIGIAAADAVLVDNATVAAKGDILVGDATTRAGSFTAQKGATVAADAGSVSVYAKGDATVDGGTTAVTANNGDVAIDANGNIEVKGATVAATGGDATLTAGKDDSIDKGRIDISGTVAATATDDQDPKGGNVTLTAKGADVADDPAKSAVEITGTVTADQKAAINATVGGVDVKGGTVVANGKDDANVGVAINAGTDVTVSGTAVAKGGDANIDAAGGVEVADGKVLAVADDNAGTSGSVDMTAGASVKLTGAAEVTADQAVTITADGNDGEAAPTAVHVTGTSTIEAGTSVTVNSTGAGDITVDTAKSVTAKNGNVTIDNENGNVSLQNATVKAKGDNGSVEIDAKGNVVIEKGSQNAVVKSDKKDVLIEATDGNISIKDAIVTAGGLHDEAYVGNLRLGSSAIADGKGTITIDAGVTMNAGQNVTIEAQRAVEIKSDVTAMAEDAVVLAKNGAVNMAKNTTLTAGSDVVVEATSGVDLSMVKASTDTGTVVVKTTGGSIIDVNADDAANVTAKSASFDAPNGSVGVGGNHVDTSVGVVAATAMSGAFLTEVDGVEVGTVEKVGATTVATGGAIGTRDTSPVAGLTSTDSGAIVLEATIGDVTVSQSVDAKGANGNVLIAAKADAGSVTVGATVTAAQNATVAAGKDVNINADVTATSGDAYVEAKGGDVKMASGAMVKAKEHSARIAAKNDVELSQIEAANVSVKAGRDITDNLQAETANIKATNLRLEAGRDIGKAKVGDVAGDNLNTDVANIEVKAGGNAIIKEKDAVTVGKVDGVTVATVTAEGSAPETSKVTDDGLDGINVSGTATLVTGGRMTVPEAVQTGKDLLVSATADGIAQDAAITAGQNVSVIADAGNVDQNANITATAGTIDVEATNGSIVMADGTTVKTTDQNIRLRSKGGITMEKIDAKGGSVTLDTDGDLVMASADAKVTADGLAVKANKVGAEGDKMKFSVSKLAVDSATDVYVDNDKSVTVTSAGGESFKVVRVKPDGTEGFASSDEINGVVAKNGDVDLDVTSGNLVVDSGSAISSTGVTDVNVNGALVINGQVSGGTTSINAGGDLTVNGNVAGASLVKAGGSVNVNSSIQGGNVNVEAGNDIAFDEDANVSGADVTLVAENGSITQSDATITATAGRVPDTKVNAAVTASGKATLTAENGSIGSVGTSSADYVGVEAGSVAANAGGDAAIADPNGDGLVVDNGGIRAGGNVAVYTAGAISGNGTISAQNVTISAKSYDDADVPVKISAGSSLTVNNFENGMNPLLAVFESTGGSDRPSLANLPNKTVVFFNGRLLGGDLQTINTVGSIEAFPVQTPELKSEQGIFGNPTFLHNELDVSNPMAVGAIDFILLEIPRLTLSDDFPLEVERHVAAAGLNPTTTYWFGQSNEESKDKAEGNDGSEPPASGEKPDEKGDEGTTPVHTAKN